MIVPVFCFRDKTSEYPINECSKGQEMRQKATSSALALVKSIKEERAIANSGEEVDEISTYLLPSSKFSVSYSIINGS